MTYKRMAAVLVLALLASGCSTRTYFKLPEDTKVAVYKRTQQYDQGMVTTRPFFWTAAGGIPYQLSDAQGQVVQEGKLRARFRVVSIFWTPFALIYWPMGFGQSCYDLTNAQPQFCTQGDFTLLRQQERLRR